MSSDYDADDFDATSDYAAINIVDRGAAIANFIGTASFPGASTSADVTGAINFVEKDGGSIVLNWQQKEAYDAIPTGILASSLTTTPTLAEENLSSTSSSLTSILDAIADVDADIIGTETITDDNEDQEDELNALIVSATGTITDDNEDQEDELNALIVSATGTIADDNETQEDELNALMFPLQEQLQMIMKHRKMN